jgi:trans-2,3-dihydro-3-hydroxyanthranilate isomerase
VLQSDKADFRVRYFTPADEIPFAGHPTVATTHTLLETGKIAFEGTAHTIRLEMKVGIIPVEITRQSKTTLFMMTQNPPKFLRTYSPNDVMPVVGLAPEDALEGYSIQTVSTGTPHLMIPVKSHAALKRAVLQHGAYKALRVTGDFFGGPHLFCVRGVTEKGDTFARHLGLPPDTHEDPFTGSSTGSMASYLWHYGLLQKNKFIAEQGHWMNRPGSAQVEIIGERDNITAVKVGGEAVTVLSGTLYL